MLPEGFEQGTVEWFDAREGKRFGFLVVEGRNGSEELFFHFNDGQMIQAKASVARGRHPDFTGQGTREVGGKIVRLRSPKQGDQIIFRRPPPVRRYGHGYKAAPWGYHTTWQAAQQWLDDHRDEIAKYWEAVRQKEANRPVYRVWELYRTLIGHPEGEEPKILWEGQDLDRLQARYPVPRGRTSPSADPLLSYWSDTDNIFEIRHWFEVQNSDGSWERCDDPRPLTGVLRQFERINRR